MKNVTVYYSVRCDFLCLNTAIVAHYEWYGAWRLGAASTDEFLAWHCGRGSLAVKTKVVAVRFRPRLLPTAPRLWIADGFNVDVPCSGVKHQAQHGS